MDPRAKETIYRCRKCGTIIFLEKTDPKRCGCGSTDLKRGA